MTPYPYPDARLIIFAKAPLPGYCKTRLIPALGEQGAADLQQVLIQDCLGSLCTTPLCPTELWCSPDTQQPFFQAMATRFGLALHAQQGSDLGGRMHHAMAQQASPYTLIVGTDCPVLDRDYVEAAIRHLIEGWEAVVGPAEDGGYVLLGLQRLSQGLFSGVEWGSGLVFRQTAHRLDSEAYRWRTLPTLWDLDHAGDLERYRRLRANSK